MTTFDRDPPVDDLPDAAADARAADDPRAAAFDSWLRSELLPVTTAPARAADLRRRAHAELRRASDPPAVPAGRRIWRLLETSSALAAGASYILWTLDQLYRR